MQAIVRYIRSHRGQSVVEIALALPFLMLVLAGMCDFGLYMYKTTLANEAARAGARAATLHKTNKDIIAAAKKATPLRFDDNAEPTVNPVPQAEEARTSDSEVTVTVEGQHTLLTKDIAAIFGSGKVTIKGTATMRME